MALNQPQNFTGTEELKCPVQMKSPDLLTLRDLPSRPLALLSQDNEDTSDTFGETV